MAKHSPRPWMATGLMVPSPHHPRADSRVRSSRLLRDRNTFSLRSLAIKLFNDTPFCSCTSQFYIFTPSRKHGSELFQWRHTQTGLRNYCLHVVQCMAFLEGSSVWKSLVLESSSMACFFFLKHIFQVPCKKYDDVTVKCSCAQCSQVQAIMARCTSAFRAFDCVA